MILRPITAEPLPLQPTEIFPAYVDYLQPARFKIAYGGRGSAKTRTFVAILLNNVMYHGWRLACFREIMKSLEDSVYQEFIDEIERRGHERFFKRTKNSIECPFSGGKIKFDGLLRNQQKVKGYANYNACWIEEAENVSGESWTYLIPTFRKDDSEIWVSYNPVDPLSATHLLWVSDCKYPDYRPDGRRYCIVKKINYVDNPRFPEELKMDMELMKENDYEMYLHVYEGEPVGNSNLAIIKPMWIAAAIDAHKKVDPDGKPLFISTKGQIMAGFDVADEGPDKNAFTWRKNVMVQGCEEWKDQDPNTAARHVFNNALQMGIGVVTFDNIGVGAGAKGAIREEKATLMENNKMVARVPKYRGFTANATPANPTREYMPGKKNEDMFLNLKAQAWWLVADRFKATYDALQGKPYDPENIIVIPSDEVNNVAKLAAELSQPRREFKNGKFAVESKKDMAKRGVVSPNLADSLIMAFAPDDGFKIENLI